MFENKFDPCASLQKCFNIIKIQLRSLGNCVLCYWLLLPTLILRKKRSFPSKNSWKCRLFVLSVLLACEEKNMNEIAICSEGNSELHKEQPCVLKRMVKETINFRILNIESRRSFLFECWEHWKWRIKLATTVLLGKANDLMHGELTVFDCYSRRILSLAVYLLTLTNTVK